MAVYDEMAPTTAIATEDWVQDATTCNDVSGYLEAAVVLEIFEMTVNGGTTTIYIQTAFEDREESFFNIASKAWSSNPTPVHREYFYLAGSSTGSSSAPGFGRFLRVVVNQAAGATVTFAAKAILKP